MKRTTALVLLALACLTAIPSVAQARYVDGLNLYQYVQSRPITAVDPQGLALYAFDGTWQHEKQAKPTNVRRFYNLYLDRPRVYRRGIGNAADNPRRPTQILKGATGIPGLRITNEMYDEVVKNYNDGVKTGNPQLTTIDIIGFSRGGAQALHLANRIANEGIPDTKAGRTRDFLHPFGRWCKYHKNVRIRFLGLFDAVASFGPGAINIHGVPLQAPDPPPWNFSTPANVDWFFAIIRGREYGPRLGFRSIPVKAHLTCTGAATHGEIGSDDGHLFLMYVQAKFAGVQMAYHGLWPRRRIGEQRRPNW